MYRHILLPVDLNEESSWRKALPTAVDYCRAFGSRLELLNVVPDFGMGVVGQYFPPDFAEKAVARVKTELEAFAKAHVPPEVQVDTSVAYGTVYEEILKAARRAGADLILMASHRPELSDYLIGPNAARVMRHAACSVLVVRE